MKSLFLAHVTFISWSRRGRGEKCQMSKYMKRSLAKCHAGTNLGNKTVHEGATLVTVVNQAMT